MYLFSVGPPLEPPIPSKHHQLRSPIHPSCRALLSQICPLHHLLPPVSTPSSRCNAASSHTPTTLTASAKAPPSSASASKAPLQLPTTRAASQEQSNCSRGCGGWMLGQTSIPGMRRRRTGSITCTRPRRAGRGRRRRRGRLTVSLMLGHLASASETWGG